MSKYFTSNSIKANLNKFLTGLVSPFLGSNLKIFEPVCFFLLLSWNQKGLFHRVLKQVQNYLVLSEKKKKECENKKNVRIRQKKDLNQLLGEQ